MSKQQPIDRFAERLVWAEGFDVQTAHVKKSLGFHMNRRFSIWFFLLLGAVSVIASFLDARLFSGLFHVAFLVPFIIWGAYRSRRRWRIHGDAERLSISKVLGKRSWGRRDFAWAEIRGLSTKVSTDGYLDVVVDTDRGEQRMNLEMSEEDSIVLLEGLVEMQRQAKMERLSRTGYRGVRVGSEVAESEPVVAKSDSKIDTSL